jgi:hypothetical protein
MHEVEVYQNGSSVTIGVKNFEKDISYVVPTDQINYIMVRSLFEKGITYTDTIL